MVTDDTTEPTGPSDDVARPRRRTISAGPILLGFVVAVVVLGVLGSLVGVAELLGVLAAVRPQFLLVIAAVALGWLIVWGLSLRTVLATLDVAVTRRRAVAVYAAIAFANSVAPFGHVGAEPLAALFCHRGVDVDYETSLATVAGVDTLNFLPSTGLALLGIGFFTLTTGLSPAVEGAVVTLIALIVALPIAGYAVWRTRRRVSSVVARVVTALARPIGWLLPGWTPPPRAAIVAHVDRFFGGIERIAGDRRALAVALAYSAIGWLLLAGSYWLGLVAAGAAISPVVALTVVPLSMIAVLTPLPGGAGGVEAALVVLTIALTGIDPASATAAALLHRCGTYWLPILLGGSAAALLARRRRTAHGTGPGE